MLKKIYIGVFFSITALLCLGATNSSKDKNWSLEDFNFWVSNYQGIYYAYHHESGLFLSTDNKITWNPIHAGLPHKVVYPFDKNELRRLTCLYMDPKNPNRVILSTSSEVYLSEDFGTTWEKIPLDKPVSGVTTIKSCAIASNNKNRIIIGTGFNGIYETTDRGQSWTNHYQKLGPLYQGIGFYEEISALAYDPDHDDSVYLAVGFGKGVYLMDLNAKTIESLKFPGENYRIPIIELAFRPYPKPIGEETAKLLGLSSDSDSESTNQLSSDQSIPEVFPEAGFGWILEASSFYNNYTYLAEKMDWKISKRNPIRKKGLIPLSDEKKKRLKKASEQYGIYVSSWHAGDESRLKKHLALIKSRGMNSVVIDMKDEYGIITYDSGVEKAKEIDSIDIRLDVKKILKTCHDQGIYVIGRIVVFKDKHLYNYKNHEFAAWDKKTDKAWFNGREHWLDPFNQWVWEYNSDIARELEELGVDEIQYDYIRFPTDSGAGGLISNLKYRFQKENQARSDALESFLRLSRSKISIPIGTDVYGFNGWFHMGNYMGQDIPMLSEYVDVISPMNYPNHFPIDFYRWMSYMDRANYIQKEGTQRTSFMGAYNIVVRPYLQAFLLDRFGEMSWSQQEYQFFLDTQVKGALEGEASGFTFWNASNNYYMIGNDLSPYIKEYEKNKYKRIQH